MQKNYFEKTAPASAEIQNTGCVVDFRVVDELIEQDIKKLKKDVLALFRQVEAKWGNSFAIRGKMEMSVMDGEKLSKHCQKEGLGVAETLGVQMVS